MAFYKNFRLKQRDFKNQIISKKMNLKQQSFRIDNDLEKFENLSVSNQKLVSTDLVKIFDLFTLGEFSHFSSGE